MGRYVSSVCWEAEGVTGEAHARHLDSVVGENVMKGGGGMGKVPTTRIWTICHVP